MFGSNACSICATGLKVSQSGSSRHDWYVCCSSVDGIADGARSVQAVFLPLSFTCLSSLSNHTQGTATTNFLKRLACFQIGGVVAVSVEFIILPVRARTRLVESLATSIGLISEMEAYTAHSIEEDKVFAQFPHNISSRLENASRRAKTALAAAETFCKLHWRSLKPIHLSHHSTFL